MADGLAHVLLGWLMVELLSIKYPWVMKYRSIVLFGAILPDLGNFKLIMGELGAHEFYYIFLPFHSILGAFLLICIFTLIFKAEYRKRVFYLLSAGVFTHLLADYLMIYLEGKLPLFFPFTFNRVGYGVFVQAGRGLIIISILAILATVARKIIIEKRSKKALR